MGRSIDLDFATAADTVDSKAEERLTTAVGSIISHFRHLASDATVETTVKAAAAEAFANSLTGANGGVDLTAQTNQIDELQKQVTDLEAQLAAARTKPPTMEDVANSPIQLGASIGNDDKVDHESFPVDATQKELLKLLGAAANKGWLDLLIKLLNDQQVNKVQRARVLVLLRNIVNGDAASQLVGDGITQAHQDAANAADTAKAKLKKAEGDIRELERELDPHVDGSVAYQLKTETERADKNYRVADKVQGERDAAESARTEAGRKLEETAIQLKTIYELALSVGVEQYTWNFRDTSITDAINRLSSDRMSTRIHGVDDLEEAVANVKITLGNITYVNRDALLTKLNELRGKLSPAPSRS